MHYTLHQLQVFLKVTQTKSITRAAEELHLSQPAVSVQMKNFQDQFEIPLTEVIGRQLYITGFGMEIAQAAEKILSEVAAINHRTVAFKGLLAGKLQLSVVSTGKYIIPHFISQFIRQHPEIELELDVTNKARVVENLQQNATDFSLVSLMPDKLLLEQEELMQNRLYLAVPGRFEVTENDLDDLLGRYPLIFREKGSATRTLMEQFLDENGITAKRRIELTSNEAVKQAVIAGLGISLLPLIGLKNELMNGDIRIFRHPSLPLTSMWNLVWVKNKQFSPVASAFLEYIRQHKQDITTTYFDWYNQFTQE